MIAQVPQKMRPVASSIGTLVYNALGFFPAPAVYGFAYQSQGSGVNVWGLATIQGVAVFGLFLLIPVVCYRRAKDNKALKTYTDAKEDAFNQSSKKLVQMTNMTEK